MGISGKQGRSVTIADVAREAGVAPMTVSRTINGYPHIRPATAIRVRAAIERLAYSPNQAARMLMGQRSNSIGLVIPDLRNPFFAVVADGVQRAARESGALVWMVASDTDVKVEQKEIEKMLSYRVDGLLLIPSSPTAPFLRNLLKRSVPVVAIDLPIECGDADAVLVENLRGAQQATEHLIGHGYERILCLCGWRGLKTMTERVDGYTAAMRKFNLLPVVKDTATDLDSTRRIFQEMERDAKFPEAIFTLNQITTELVWQVLDEMGLRIPVDTALAGFDDFPLASLLTPRLTVVRQPASELGERAARLLFERVASGEKKMRITTVLPTELIVRQSCGCNQQTKPEQRADTMFGYDGTGGNRQRRPPRQAQRRVGK